MSDCTYHLVDMEDLYELDWRNITVPSDNIITTTSIPAKYTFIDTCESKSYIKIIYIHHTNCPNCGGLLDGDETKPYVYCSHCNAKIWSKREVNAYG